MEKRGNTGYAEAWLRRMGYQPDTRMQGMVGVWFGWFAANNGWYHYSERRGFRVYKRERASLHPAALVADECAGGDGRCDGERRGRFSRRRDGEWHGGFSC